MLFQSSPSQTSPSCIGSVSNVCESWKQAADTGGIAVEENLPRILLPNDPTFLAGLLAGLTAFYY